MITPFEIYPGVIVPVGNYESTEAQLVAFTNQGAPVSARMRLTFGGFFGGSRVVTAPQILIRISDIFSTEIIWTRNDVELSGGAFVTNLMSSRVSYSFTPRIYLQALLQYNDRANLWSSNIRFGWLNQANTGLFVVYNDTQGLARFDADAPGSEPDHQVQPPGRFAELSGLPCLTATTQRRWCSIS